MHYLLSCIHPLLWNKQKVNPVWDLLEDVKWNRDGYVGLLTRQPCCQMRQFLAIELVFIVNRAEHLLVHMAKTARVDDSVLLFVIDEWVCVLEVLTRVILRVKYALDALSWDVPKSIYVLLWLSNWELLSVHEHLEVLAIGYIQEQVHALQV